jgi:hypothetical protein
MLGNKLRFVICVEKLSRGSFFFFVLREENVQSVKLIEKIDTFILRLSLRNEFSIFPSVRVGRFREGQVFDECGGGACAAA